MSSYASEMGIVAKLYGASCYYTIGYGALVFDGDAAAGIKAV